MENMNDIKFFEVERPKIPQVLLDATVDSMKAGVRKDDFRQMSVDNTGDGQQQTTSGGGGQQQSQQQQQQKRGGRELKSNKKKGQEGNTRRSRKKKVDEDEEPEEPTFRAHGERRLGFLVIGDQHRFMSGGDKGGKRSYLYPDAPPIDFSFSLLSTIEEITSAQEPPHMKRNYKFPEKTEDDRYKTSSIRLSYNLVETIDGLVSVLYKVLDGGPLGLCWVDLSFNHINQLEDDTIGQIPNVKIMYLHGNSLADMQEIPKLQGLPLLHTLTLHGNPIEEEDGYRACVIFYLPNLKHLDFIGVTKGDKANAHKFGKFYEPFWEKRHHELENQAKQVKAAQEISFTEKLMQNEEEEEDQDFKAIQMDA